MRAVSFAVVTLFAILVLGVSLHSSNGAIRVKIRVILVDQDLNQKPVPHLSIVLIPAAGGDTSRLELKTDFAGNAEFQAPPGKLPTGHSRKRRFSGSPFLLGYADHREQ